MERIDNYELVDIGIEHPDYFQGFGACLTGFTHATYGIGDNPREALADALEQIACEGFDADELASRIAADEGWQLAIDGEVMAPESPSASGDAEEDSESYYHVGIRWTVSPPAAPPCPPPPGHRFKLADYTHDDGTLHSYAWPGGYPMFYLTADAGVLCPDCANDNRELIADPDDSQWHIVAADVNWEDDTLTCDHCSKRIESAYGEDNDDAPAPPCPPPPCYTLCGRCGARLPSATDNVYAICDACAYDDEVDLTLPDMPPCPPPPSDAMPVWRELERDPFAEAYVECALWSSMDNANDQGGAPLDDNYGIDDLADTCAAQMLADCRDFEQANRELLDASGLSIAQQGHDFWLTRNGHGAGFWDRGIGKIGEQLTHAAKAYGGCDLYVGDDGKLYC